MMRGPNKVGDKKNRSAVSVGIILDTDSYVGRDSDVTHPEYKTKIVRSGTKLLSNTWRTDVRLDSHGGTKTH